MPRRKIRRARALEASRRACFGGGRLAGGTTEGLTRGSIRVFRGAGRSDVFWREAAQGEVAVLAPAPDTGQEGVQKAVVEAGGDDAAEEVDELGVEGAGNPQRWILLFDHVQDGLGDVAWRVEGERHEARDQFVHVRVVRVVRVALVDERALRLLGEVRLAKAVGVDEAWADQRDAHTEGAHLVPQ